MLIKFFKYQGTGNDFIIIDNRKLIFPKENEKLIANLCERKFGIGADGLILFQNHPGSDFEMIYFNSDGKKSTMCGNGGRAISAFASFIKKGKKKFFFKAADGVHESVLKAEDNKSHLISLKMKDIESIEIHNNHYILDTGSPHYVKFVDNLSELNVNVAARKIRYNKRFAEKGINVNFVGQKNGFLHIRTYERGVENETLSCGTGMTAAAICASVKGLLGNQLFCRIKSQGGETTVRFSRRPNNFFQDIWLEGPAVLTFKGETEI